MSLACPDTLGEGAIRGLLAAVDCQGRVFAEAGYASLTATSSTFQLALTALLTIYIALIGYRMLWGRGDVRLSDAPGIALKIGAILALVTSWTTFQTLVFDVASKAPNEIAAVLAQPLRAGGGSLTADPVGGLQAAYEQLTQTATAFGKLAGPNVKAYANPAAAAAEALSTASIVFFLSTAGVIAAAAIAIAILTAVGPIFIALFLMPATRGLFVGWIRALAAAALAPLFGWISILLLLSVLEPTLVRMAQERAAAQLDAAAAMGAASVVFAFALAQALLVATAGVVAFGFRIPRGGARSSMAGATAELRETVSVTTASRNQRLAFELQRDGVRAESRVRADRVQTQPPQGFGSAAPATPTARLERLSDAYRRPMPTARRVRGGR